MIAHARGGLVALLLLAAIGCEPSASDDGDAPQQSMLEQGLRYDAQRFAEQAFAEMAAGNTEQASITARRAIQADASHPSAQHALAWAAMHENNPSVYIVAALEAVRLAPDSVQFRRTLGIAFRAAGRNRDATGTFRETVRRAPMDTLSWRDLGRSAYDIGDFALADSAFDQLAALVPAYFDSASADAALRRDAAARAP